MPWARMTSPSTGWRSFRRPNRMAPSSAVSSGTSAGPRSTPWSAKGNASSCPDCRTRSPTH
eukprot:2476449-Alexandrium_andersonii.AAC.1